MTELFFCETKIIDNYTEVFKMNTLFNKRLISLSLAGIIATTSLAFSASATSDLQNGENASNVAKLNEIAENLIRTSDQIKEISKGWSQTQTPSDIEESAVSSQENANTIQQAPTAESDSNVKSEEITDASDLQNPETAKPAEEELSKELLMMDLYGEIRKGHIEELIKRGVDLNREYYIEQGFDEKRLPLNFACEMGWYKNDIELLVKHGADLDKEDMFGTPLRTACIYGYLSVAKFLIDHGADVNKKSKHPYIDFNYPLHASVSGANRVYSELVEYLLKHGADVNVKDAAGKTPLERAENAKKRAGEDLDRLSEKSYPQYVKELKQKITELEKSIELLRQYGAN